MFKLNPAHWAVPALLAGLALAVTGCRVDKDRHGDNKDVSIATPFGGMKVKTNNDSAPSGLGLPSYPGAQIVKKDNNNGSADVNMSFGSFQMRVKAVTYRTPDAPEKVESFYRDSLHHFGDVIACHDGHASGAPAQTSEGLTCDSKQGNHIVVDDIGSNGKLELKAGSKQHQHIVAIEPDAGGTKFSLVALDLPGKLFSEDKDGGDRQ